MVNLRAIDVCAGAGGWAVAARGLPIRIVAAFDRDECCLATYAENHPDVECVRCDVTEQDFSAWRGVDLILGGIPCEQISTARVGTPLPEAELAEFHRLLDRCMALPGELEARWWCYEDVIQIIKHLPILTPFFVLDSAGYSPQRRKRAYVGNLPRPAPGHSRSRLAGCLRPGPYRRSALLEGRTPQRHNTYNSKTFYPWYPDKKSPTVISAGSRHDNHAAVAWDGRWRNHEWQEVALLQGFPEDYLFIGSPTRVRKMVGHAVQIETGRAILEALCNHKDTKAKTAVELLKKHG